MEIFSQPGFMSALFAIILIDLALAGDNALVIGLAVRNIPAEMQKKAILWGTVGAIVIRCLLTLIVVWLLKIPGFMLAGGLALVWIAHKLASEDGGGEHNVAAKSTLRGAIGTIVVADTVMGLENVLAVGGAANGNMVLVVLGLLISIPIIVLGSQVVIKAVNRFPWLIIAGAAVLAWTAAKMIVSEPFLKSYVGGPEHHVLRNAIYLIVIGIAIGPVLWRKLARDARVRFAQCAFVIAWLMFFDWLEVRLDWDMDPIESWKVWHETLDLVKFLGWIPLVIAMEKWRKPPALGAAPTR
jgi:YjbE family integral membrane protein